MKPRKKKSRYYETKEELNVLKEEVEALNKKLAELTEDELAQVAGGLIPDNPADFELKPPLAEPLSFEPESFTPKNLVFVKTDVQ